MVLAFLGMQLWSISSLKNLNGEHQYFSREAEIITPQQMQISPNLKYLSLTVTAMPKLLRTEGESFFYLNVAAKPPRFARWSQPQACCRSQKRIWWAASRFLHV